MPLPGGVHTTPNSPQQKRFQHDQQKAAAAYLPTITSTTSPSNVPVANLFRSRPKPVNLPGLSLTVPNPGAYQYKNPELRAFLQGISDQESGGNYSAVGVQTKYGTALGKYQILDANIAGPGGWDKEALQKDISLEQFMNSPKLQEAIARTKLTEYFKQYGASGAAKAWYAGPGNANSNSDSPQYGGPSIVDYANSVLANMQRHL